MEAVILLRPPFCCLHSIRLHSILLVMSLFSSVNVRHRDNQLAQCQTRRRFYFIAGRTGIKREVGGFGILFANGYRHCLFAVFLVPRNQGIASRRKTADCVSAILADCKKRMLQHADVRLHPRMLIAFDVDKGLFARESLVDRRCSRSCDTLKASLFFA